MSEQDHFAFEMYPRRDLAVKIDRRQMFRTFATASEVREGQRRGGNAFTLSSLGSLADELLGLLVPATIPGCRIAEDSGLVWAHLPGADRPVALFPIDSPARTILHRFDGRSMVEVIARDLAADQEWSEAKAFAYTRGLFLHLTVLGVCLPR